MQESGREGGREGGRERWEEREGGGSGIRMNHAAVAGETLHFVAGQTLVNFPFGKQHGVMVLNISAEVTVLNINAAPLLERKIFPLQYWNADATIGTVVNAIRRRVEDLVRQCRDEERTAEERDDPQLPDFDRMLKEYDNLGDCWADFVRPTRGARGQGDVVEFVPYDAEEHGDDYDEFLHSIRYDIAEAARVLGSRSAMALEQEARTKKEKSHPGTRNPISIVFLQNHPELSSLQS